MLVGIVVGVMFGVMFEKFARIRRDRRSAKKAVSILQWAYVSILQWAYWTSYLPRMLVIGFVCGCAGIAAFRIMFGTVG